MTKEGMVFAIAFLVFELATIAAAWRFGGPPERAGAGILLAMVVVTYGGYGFLSPIFQNVDPVGLAVDLIGLAGFSWLGITSRKLWPLWAASLQLLSTGAHFIRALEIPVRAPVYYWMKGMPTLGVILLLIAATWLHRRRLRRSKLDSSPH
jgi:hypothetical protein